MNGLEHYREAERLLVHTERAVVDQFGEGAECARQQIAMAQVHATLALTAAMAMQPSGTNGEFSADEFKPWHDACSSEGFAREVIQS